MFLLTWCYGARGLAYYDQGGCERMLEKGFQRFVLKSRVWVLTLPSRYPRVRNVRIETGLITQSARKPWPWRTPLDPERWQRSCGVDKESVTTVL